MADFKITHDKQNNIIYLDPELTGAHLLNIPALNKGSAFTYAERELLQLTGFLPEQIETLEQQAKRVYGQYQQYSTHFSKYLYLQALHDCNMTLFYKLVSEHFEEMLPIIYTPTVGQAVQRFSAEYRRPSGLYLSYTQRGHIHKIIAQHISAKVDLVIITDGEAVLGIGDQGIGGIHIVTAKQMVYALAAKINPQRILALQLDVGTNNTQLLNDPMYLGWRHERIDQPAYDSFISEVIQAIYKKRPYAFIHWEDIGRENAWRILHRYKDTLCTFNGDIQSTGVVTLACVLASVIASQTPLAKQRIIMMGAGNAGMGIVEQIYAAMRRLGMSEAEARACFWLIDKPGLLTTETPTLTNIQSPYARNVVEVAHWTLSHSPPSSIQLLDVVKNMKPTMLIGCSAVAGAFTEEIVKKMATFTKQPIIMPLSNPDTLAEAVPADLIQWTEGQAIIATGTPFPDVQYQNKRYRIALSNNAMAFPGIGLGILATRAQCLSDDMLWEAAYALSQCSPVHQDLQAPLLPDINQVHPVTLAVALAVANQARQQGLASVPDDLSLEEAINNILWSPRYATYQYLN